MLSDPFNNTLRELLAPKGVAKWPFDPSSGLLIPQGGSFKDLGTPEIQILPDFSFKRTLRGKIPIGDFGFKQTLRASFEK